MASIRSRIRGGESATLEYKSTCPEPARLARILCAFANGDGGEIAIGISNSGEPVGVEDPAAERATVEQAIHLVEPELDVEIETAVHEFRDFVFVTVRPTEFPGFCAVQDDSRNGTVYVRMLSETRPLDPDLVKEATRLRRRYGGDRTLDADASKLVTWLWTKGEAKEQACAKRFNFSSHRLRKLAEATIGTGHVIHCRHGDGRSYLALRPATAR
ncbi:MAG: ATP-binding protein [Planctomycetota bacterium]